MNGRVFLHCTSALPLREHKLRVIRSGLELDKMGKFGIGFNNTSFKQQKVTSSTTSVLSIWHLAY